MIKWIWHIQHYSVLLIDRYCKYEIKACSKRSILQHIIIQMPPLWDLICKSHWLLKQGSYDYNVQSPCEFKMPSHTLYYAGYSLCAFQYDS